MALFSFTWLLLPFESITSPQLYILPPSLFIGITFIDTEGGSIFHFPRKIELKMNPIVKVRAQDDQFSPRNDTGLLLFLRTIDTLSMQAEDHQSHSPSPVDRITKVHVPNIRTQSSPMSQGTMKNNFKHVSTNSKSNVRANSVLRPRAVLSSPDNDGMIGSINKLMEDRSLDHSKKERMALPAQIKTVHNQVKAAVPLNTRKGSKEVSDRKSGIKQRKSGPEPVTQKQKPRVGEGKSSLHAV
ncbi:uncharacterized protein LOC122305793 isoform X3 [Carya illinoinensis]|uniref:uncharacterized protein LOC122305793 isoform X3 n=1 Tax=Carya illinoinensis TaxID=32201 RepID=UPI001C719B07|nr:uncharacterized protein LOC122305793 isoform X3 [Carya illinoinensis]